MSAAERAAPPDGPQAAVAAATPLNPTGLSAVLAAATQLLERALAGADLAAVADTELQQLLAAAVRIYAAKNEQHESLKVFPPHSVTATDVVVTATAMLDAVDVGVFELGMWRTVKGRPSSL